MRTALLVGIPRTGSHEIVAGPAVPIDQQIAIFKKLSAARDNARLAELQLWISDHGISKRIRFRDPKQVQESAQKDEAVRKAEVERLASEEQAKADRLAQEKAEADAKDAAIRAEQDKIIEKSMADRRASRPKPPK